MKKLIALSISFVAVVVISATAATWLQSTNVASTIPPDPNWIVAPKSSN